jgi:hypothetical protein
MTEITHPTHGAGLECVIPEVVAPLLRVAEDQPEFVPITVAMVQNPEFEAVLFPESSMLTEGRWNTVLMAFRPNDEQRARIAEGADLYIALLTFGNPQQGIIVLAGREDAAAVFNVPVRDPDKPFVSPLLTEGFIPDDGVLGA